MKENTLEIDDRVVCGNTIYKVINKKLATIQHPTRQDLQLKIPNTFDERGSFGGFKYRDYQYGTPELLEKVRAENILSNTQSMVREEIKSLNPRSLTYEQCQSVLSALLAVKVKENT